MSDLPPPAEGLTPPPVPLTSFIGRDQELATLSALLQRPDVRLVTLTGPGGIGKTRLALQVVDRLRDQVDEVVSVSLAPVRDPNLVLPTIAQALNVHDATGQSLLDQLQAHLQNRHLLLVLDNLEHLLETAAPLVVHLLTTCPCLTVLATSRVRLGISGEQVVPVAPLDRETARMLFVARTMAADPGFHLTPDTTPIVDAICDRLDRLPLAIELAAARINVLPPVALLARLGQRFDLLCGGPRDAPDRQRDMRAAITWSHDLLTEPQQVLFRRLGVFVGGFTLEAAEAVAGEGTDVLAGVSSLVAASLVNPAGEVGDEPRFTMLETIRDYALEQLAASGEEPAFWQRHATWFSALTDRFNRALFTSDETNSLDRLEWDHANLRETMAWYEQAGDKEMLLRVAGSLGQLWAMHGYGQEGRYWLERATEDLIDVPAHVAAVALRSLSRLLNQQAIGDRALALAERALALARDEDDQRGVVHSLTLCGVAAFKVGDLERAVAYQEEALALLDAAGDQPWTQYFRGVALTQLGNYGIHSGAIDKAECWYLRAAELDTVPGSADSDDDLAIPAVGDVARARGDDARALRQYWGGLRRAWGDGDMRAVAYALGGVAGALAGLGHHELAARLFGLSEALHEDLGVPFAVETFDRQRAFGLPEPWAAEHTSFGVAQRLRDALGNRGYPCAESAWIEP
jgi:predicted ATPase